jgi:hypothetical protein
MASRNRMLEKLVFVLSGMLMARLSIIIHESTGFPIIGLLFIGALLILVAIILYVRSTAIEYGEPIRLDFKCGCYFINPTPRAIMSDYRVLLHRAARENDCFECDVYSWIKEKPDDLHVLLRFGMHPMRGNSTFVRNQTVIEVPRSRYSVET